MIEKGVIRRIWVDCKVLVLHDCRFFVASAGKLMMILGGIGPRKLGGITSNRPRRWSSGRRVLLFLMEEQKRERIKHVSQWTVTHSVMRNQMM
jgi:hypothetical protein